MKQIFLSLLLGVCLTDAFVSPSSSRHATALFSDNHDDILSRRSVLAGSLVGAAAFLPLVASAKVSNFVR